MGEASDGKISHLDAARKFERKLTPEEMRLVADRLRKVVDACFTRADTVPDLRSMQSSIMAASQTPGKNSILGMLTDVARYASGAAQLEPERRFVAGMNELIGVLGESYIGKPPAEFLEFLHARLDNIQWYATRENAKKGEVEKTS